MYWIISSSSCQPGIDFEPTSFVSDDNPIRFASDDGRLNLHRHRQREETKQATNTAKNKKNKTGKNLSRTPLLRVTNTALKSFPQSSRICHQSSWQVVYKVVWTSCNPIGSRLIDLVLCRMTCFSLSFSVLSPSSELPVRRGHQQQQAFLPSSSSSYERLRFVLDVRVSTSPQHRNGKSFSGSLVAVMTSIGNSNRIRYYHSIYKSISRDVMRPTENSTEHDPLFFCWPMMMFDRIRNKGVCLLSDPFVSLFFFFYFVDRGGAQCPC